MIRKIFLGIFVILMLGASYWLVTYFYNKSGRSPIVYKTESPELTDIIKKTVATGSIVPRKEIEIKPQASGIIQDLFVEAGDPIKEGAIIARVRLEQSISGRNTDQISLNNAQNNYQTAQVNYKNAQVELDRQKKLYDDKVISQQEYNRFQLDFNLQKEALDAAKNNLNLVKQGILQNSGAISNEIYSTVTGMVLDVPVKVGTSVIERNNFNEGTTIASIADMNNLVFEGQIDESEVGKLKEGMEMDLTIGAIEGKTFSAILEYISPKGVSEEGTIKFDIRARLQLKEDDYLRAGYSANADIVLDKREKVLAIKESMLQFKKSKEREIDSVYVEVETAPQQFEKRYIKTGISDGINIEVISGLKKDEKVKLPIKEDGDEKKEDEGE